MVIEKVININLDEIKKAMALFDKYDFQYFCYNILKKTYGDLFYELPMVGDGVFEMYEPYSFEPPVHAYLNPTVIGPFAFTYISHYFPIEAFKKPNINSIVNREIIGKINKLSDRLKNSKYPISKDDHTIYFLNNFTNIDEGFLNKQLIPRYYEELFKIGFNKTIGIGTYDTFVDQNPTKIEKLFLDFVGNSHDGIIFEFTDSSVSVNAFQIEKPLPGVTHNSLSLIQPIYKTNKMKYLIKELGNLIEKNPKESIFEEFFREYYFEIFNGQYDRVETQVVLDLPDLYGKKRRIDMLLRSYFSNDWELFEFKRPIRNIFKNINDTPSFASVVKDAIEQIGNYKKMLSQDYYKKKFKREGIEYFEPKYSIIIGRKPQISQPIWRRIINDTEEKENLKLLTYDDILLEMKNRIEIRSKYQF